MLEQNAFVGGRTAGGNGDAVEQQNGGEFFRLGGKQDGVDEHEGSAAVVDALVTHHTLKRDFEYAGGGGGK